MAKKKVVHTDIDFGDDDMSVYDNPDNFDMDFDDDELNLDNGEFGSKNRSPVLKAGRVLGKAVTNTLGDEYFIRETIAEKLPQEFTTSLESFDQIGAGVNKVYSEVSKNIKPGVDAAAKTLRQVISKDSKFVPKWLNDKLTEASESSDYQARQNIETERTDFIGSQLQELMNTQMEVSTNQLMTDAVEREKDRSVENDRFNMSAFLQQQMNQSIANIDSYHRNFHTAYAKKHLEVSYRSLFVLQDILSQNREATKAQLEQLAAISKNTSLPDYVKYQGIEITKELIKRGMAEKTVEPIVRKGSDITQKLFSNLAKAAGDKARDISDNLVSGTDFISMMKDMREMDQDGFGDEVQSNLISAIFGGKLKQYTKRMVGRGYGAFEDSKYYKPVMKGVRKTDAFLRNAPHSIQDGINDPRYIRQVLQGYELENDDQEKLLENVNKFKSGDGDTLTLEELEAVYNYLNKNIVTRNMGKMFTKFKRAGLDFADQHLDTISEGIVDNRRVVDFEDKGAGDHFTKSEDLLRSKQQVDDTINKVIPRYLQSILQEISTIRKSGFNIIDNAKEESLHFDWDSGKLTNSETIASKIQSKAYDPKKAQKLQESLARMISAGDGLSDEAASSLINSIMRYWQSDDSKGSSARMGSTIELFTENYYKDRLSNNPNMEALHPDAEKWLAENIGDRPNLKENAARRTKQSEIKRFKEIDKYWSEAARNRESIDPRVVYAAARSAGYEHEHIAKGLNIQESNPENRDFLGSRKYTMDIGGDSRKITDMVLSKNYSEVSANYKSSEEIKANKEIKEKELSYRALQDLREQKQREKQHASFMAKHYPEDNNSNETTETAQSVVPAKQKRAKGGPVISAQPDGVDTEKALTLGKDVVLAGGEHVFTDQEVKSIGGGNADEGHKRLTQYRASIRGNSYSYKTPTLKDEIKVGLEKSKNKVTENLSAAAQIVSMQVQAKAMRKRLDSGYKLTEQEINSFAQSAGQVTGMSDQAVALALTYADTDQLATKLNALGKMADVKQIKETVEQISNSNYQVKEIITAKDKVADSAKGLYTKAKEKLTNIVGLEKDKEQSPVDLQQPEQREVLFTRQSNNRKENTAAMLRDKIEASKKVTKTSEYLQGDREQQKVQALLDNAKLIGDKKSVKLYTEKLNKEFGVKSNTESIKDNYSKIMSKVMNKDMKSEITHRDLTASIKEYIDSIESGKYLDYRATGSIAEHLSKAIPKTNPETIAHMLDWTMHQSLIEVMRNSIPFRGEDSVVAFYNAIEQLYQHAKPMAQVVMVQLENNQTSPVAKYFTVTINNKLKSPVRIPQPIDQSAESSEFQELSLACKEFIKASSSKAAKLELYQKLSAYSGIAQDKISLILDKIPTQALVTLLSPVDGAKVLARIIHSPKDLYKYISTGVVSTKEKTNQYIQSKKKIDFNQINFKDYSTEPSLTQALSSKTSYLKKYTEDKVKKTIDDTSGFIRSSAYKISDDFVGPQKPLNIIDFKPKFISAIDSGLEKTKIVSNKIQDNITQQLQDIQPVAANKPLPIRDAGSGQLPEFLSTSKNSEDLTSKYGNLNIIDKIIANQSTPESKKVDLELPIKQTLQAVPQYKIEKLENNITDQINPDKSKLIDKVVSVNKTPDTIGVNNQVKDKAIIKSNNLSLTSQVKQDYIDLKDEIVKNYETIHDAIIVANGKIKTNALKSKNEFKTWLYDQTPKEAEQYVQYVNSAYSVASIASGLNFKTDATQQAELSGYQKLNYNQNLSVLPNNPEQFLKQQYDQSKLSNERIVKMIEQFSTNTGIEVKKDYDNSDGFEGADIYISGQKTPAMSYKDIKAGYFVDVVSGNPISKAEDIKGDIIDIRTGEIVVKADQLASLVHVRVDRTTKGNGTFIKKGLLSRFIPGGVKYSQLVGSKLGAIARGQYTAFDFIKDMVMLPFKAVDMAVQFALDRPADIYISDGQGGISGMPVLTKKQMKEGEYFNVNGVPIYTPTDIKGPVVDKYGDVIVDKDDLRKGLCFKNGRKIEGPWMRILKKAARAYMYPFKKAAQATWWMTKKANSAVGWMLGKGAKGLLNLERSKGSIEETQTEVSIFSAQQLAGINQGISAINKTQQDQIKAEKSKTIRSGSWKERMFGKKKETIKDPAAIPKDGPKEKSTFAKAMDFIKDWGPLIIGGAALIGPAIMNSNFGKIITDIGSGIGIAATSIKDVATWMIDKGTILFEGIDAITQKLFNTQLGTGSKLALTGGAALGAAAIASKLIPSGKDKDGNSKPSKGALGFISGTIKSTAKLLMKVPGARWAAIAGVLYTLSSLFGDSEDDGSNETTGDSEGSTGGGSGGYNSSDEAKSNGPGVGTMIGAAAAGMVGKRMYDKYKGPQVTAAQPSPQMPAGNIYQQYANDNGKPNVVSPPVPKTGPMSKIADYASKAKDYAVKVKDAAAPMAGKAVSAAATAGNVITGGKLTKAVNVAKNAGSAIADTANKYLPSSEKIKTALSDKSKTITETIKTASDAASKYLPSAESASKIKEVASSGLSKAGNVVSKIAGWKSAVLMAGTGAVIDNFADKGSLTTKAAQVGTNVAGWASTGAAAGSFVPVVGNIVGGVLGAAYGIWDSTGQIKDAWKQWKDLDPKSIRAVRYAGYGFVGAAANMMHRSLMALETNCAASITKSNINTVDTINVQAINIADVASLLGYDSKNPQALQTAERWFMTRFKPVFEAHYNSVMRVVEIKDGKVYQAFDSLDSENNEVKARYINLVISSIPNTLPAYVFEGSNLIGKTILTDYNQVVTIHKSWNIATATNDTTVNKPIKEGIAKVVGNEDGNAQLTKNYVSRGSNRNIDQSNITVNTQTANATNVNIPVNNTASVRESIVLASADPRQTTANSQRRQTSGPIDPSKSTIRVGYASDRGTTEYGPTGSGDTYISGTTRIRDNRDPINAASGVYSTQRVYNPSMRDGDDVIEDVEYYDKDVTEESKPTTPGGKENKPGNLFSAKGGLYSGDNAKTFIVFGKNPDGLPIDINGLMPEFKVLVMGCIEEYGKRTGKTVQINSAARSSQQQAALYKRMPGKAAPPGSSPHEFGFAIDINTADLDAMEKLGLMRKYGLCRPLSAESWHVEPIGIQIDYYRAKSDRAYAAKMIMASPGRGGSGPGDTMRGKGFKVRRVFAVLKDIWDRPPMFMPEDNAMANVKPQIKYTGIVQTGFSPNAKPSNDKNQPTAVSNKTVDTDVEKPSPMVKTRTSYANAVDQAQAATNQSVPTNWKQGTKDAAALKQFKALGKTPEEVKTSIKEAAKHFGMNPDIPLVIAQLESSMGQSLQASTSSAKGIFQFTDVTWKDAIGNYIKDNGPDAGITGMESPLDNRSSILVGLNFLKRRLEKGADVQELYLRHLFGDTGYSKFKSGTEQGKMPYEAASAAAVKANQSLFYDDEGGNKVPFTTAQFRDNLFKDKFVQAAAVVGLNTVPGSSSQSITTPDYKTAINKPSSPSGSRVSIQVSDTGPQGIQVNTPKREMPVSSEKRTAPSTKTVAYMPDSPTTPDTQELKERTKTQLKSTAEATQFTADPIKKILEESMKVQTEHLDVSKQILTAIKEHINVSKEFRDIVGRVGSKDKEDKKEIDKGSVFTPKSQTVNSRTIPAPSQFPTSTVSTGRALYDSSQV